MYSGTKLGYVAWSKMLFAPVSLLSVLVVCSDYHRRDASQTHTHAGDQVLPATFLSSHEIC